MDVFPYLTLATFSSIALNFNLDILFYSFTLSCNRPQLPGLDDSKALLPRSPEITHQQRRLRLGTASALPPVLASWPPSTSVYVVVCAQS